jgi:acyl-CoA synthetase (AMP-forming)/AMP-acid ligase II
MLTHAGLLLAASVQHARLNPAQPRYLCNLPINHVGCLMNLTLAALVGGGSIVFQQRFSAAGSLQLIRDERVNCWLQVPAMFHECVRDPAFEPKELRHLHSICIGGGAVSVQTLAKLRQIGVPIVVEYGQTETTSSGTYSDADATDEVLTHCIGRFDSHFEFRIADVENLPCSIGEVGEIQARGELIFAGYFADPNATSEAFSADGWLHTGDLAMYRPDGNVVLQGRRKEMIKTGGYNVYPREVELVIETHPCIAQVVVVGLPDERYGETVNAVISCSNELIQGEELTTLCRQRLANYKVPKSFRVIPSFPLLANGKIDRVGTRAIASELPVLD